MSSITIAELRAEFVSMVQKDDFVRRFLLNAVNNRINDFQDPLTSTLVLMATIPLQLVFCESGLLLFKTNLLPVLPYTSLTEEEKAKLFSLLEPLVSSQLMDNVESSGQFTLTVLPFHQNPNSSASVQLLCQMRLLTVFVDVMLARRETDRLVNSTLANIVLQRFWSRVSTSSEMISTIMGHLKSIKSSSTSSTAVSSSSCTTTTTQCISDLQNMEEANAIEDEGLSQAINFVSLPTYAEQEGQVCISDFSKEKMVVSTSLNKGMKTMLTTASIPSLTMGGNNTKKRITTSHGPAVAGPKRKHQRITETSNNV